MSKSAGKALCIALAAVLLLSALPACGQAGGNGFSGPVRFSSYKEVPGVTDAEIRDIESLAGQFEYFIYGMPLSSEAFPDGNGEVGGFSALVCRYLTELFGIPFRPALYEWAALLEGLETGEISFSGELTRTTEREDILFMTGAMAMRPVRCFRLEGSKPFEAITSDRPLRCGFIEGAATIRSVTAELAPGTYEIVTVNDFSLIRGALLSGDMDAFFYSGVAEVNFVEYGDIEISDFYPLTFMPVSFATQNPALAPIVTVLDKALRNGGLQYLTTLYEQGYNDYLRYKLFMRLTEEELAYIKENPVIPYAAEADNFPVSFYSAFNHEWQE